MSNYRCTSGPNCQDPNNANPHLCVRGCGVSYHAICLNLRRSQCDVLEFVRSHFKFVCDDCQKRDPLHDIQNEIKSIGDYLNKEFLQFKNFHDVLLNINSSIDEWKSKMNSVEAKMLSESNRNTAAYRTLRDELSSGGSSSSTTNQEVMTKINELDAKIEFITVLIDVNKDNILLDKLNSKVDNAITSAGTMMQQLGSVSRSHADRLTNCIVENVVHRLDESLAHHQQVMIDNFDVTLNTIERQNRPALAHLLDLPNDISLSDELMNSSIPQRDVRTDETTDASPVVDLTFVINNDSNKSNNPSAGRPKNARQKRKHCRSNKSKSVISSKQPRIHFCIHPSRLPNNDPGVIVKGLTQSRTGTWRMSKGDHRQSNDNERSPIATHGSQTTRHDKRHQTLAAHPRKVVQSSWSNNDCTRDKRRSTFLPHSDTWLYLYNVGNDVTEDAIKEYASKHLRRDNVICRMLLPKGVNPRSRRSLSFKVRVPSSCAYLALDNSFWPSGVRASYFTNNEDFQNSRQRK